MRRLAAVDHSTYLEALREQSDLFATTLAGVPADRPVPTCPGWTVGDLHRHLTEVHAFWAQVVGAGLDGGDVPEPDRPRDGVPADVAAGSRAALLVALAGRDPAQECWSWAPDGHSVGWVARRQAHEALIHRVDAELAAGLPVTAPPAELAADGVDELLTVLIDGVPGDGELTLDGTTLRLSCTDAAGSWVLALGSFAGTDDDGEPYTVDVAPLLTQDDGGQDDAVVSGPAWDLDRWLWGRGPLDALTVEGDGALAARLRAMVVASTQ